MKDLINQNRNYKTTYKNHEVSIGQYALNRHYELDPHDTTAEVEQSIVETYKDCLPAIHDIVETDFTSKQKTLFQLHFNQDMPVSTVAKQLNVSQQTVHQAIYGHPRNGGGIIRKLQKSLPEFYQPSA